MSQRIEEKIVILSAIESERHFVQVGGQMLGADLVPASCDAAFQERERRFDSVCVNVGSAPDVFFLPVVNFLMAVAEIPKSAPIGGQFIGDDYIHILRDILLNVFCERAHLGIFGMKEAQIAVALANTDDNFLVLTMTPAPIFSSAARFSADVGFVHLNCSVQHRTASFFHGRADAMTEIPSRLVAHAERALNLASGHSFFRFAEQKCGEKPLCERQMGVIENRARRDGELVVAVLAIEKLFVGFQFDSGHLAARALRASGPAQTGEQFAAFFVSREQSVYIN